LRSLRIPDILEYVRFISALNKVTCSYTTVTSRERSVDASGADSNDGSSDNVSPAKGNTGGRLTKTTTQPWHWPPDFSHAWHRVTTESLASCVRAPRHSSLVGQGRIIFRPLVLEASQYQHDTVHVTPVRFHWIAAPHARGRSFSRLK
jgi:hypothetical protein